ncbi:MAG: hypothetical protein KAJ90_04415 [Desulfobacterales bacterium]|nr:hypothetical protein [Desulfobacterales bacterium]
MCEKSPDKTTKDTLDWPFYPRYLTQILPEDVLTLLLAGIVERLKAPLIMWEKRDDIEPIYPVEQMSCYPRFCKILSLKDLQDKAKISPQGSERLKEIDKNCLADSRKRARSVLSLKQQDTSEYCPRCHLCLTSCSVPIKVAEHRVAVCTSGKFIQEKDKVDIIEAVDKLGLNQEDSLKLKRLIDGIPNKTGVEIKEFRSQFEKEIEIVEQVAENYVSKYREEREWRLQTELGSRFNRIFLEEGMNLRQKTRPILKKIKDFFKVSFVALFCSAQPGDTVLRLFAQVGCEDKKTRDIHFNWKKAALPVEDDFDPYLRHFPRVGCDDKKTRDIHFNWKKAELSVEDDFDSYEWLRKERKSGEYPSNFLDKALKGAGHTHMLKSSFLLPYLYGNQYRGIFLMGPSSSILPDVLNEERGDFLSAVGHLVITRILALVAIEALRKRENWRELMTRLWAHGIRSDLHTLMGENYEFEKRSGNKELLADDQKRLKIAVDRMNDTLEEMKNTARLAIQAPEAAISTKIDRTEVKKEYYTLSVLVHNAVERIRKRAKRMNISIEIEEGVDDLPGVRIDLRLMGLVFKNILDNAVKYSKTGSMIRIYGSTVDTRLKQEVKISVEDYGLGIKKEELSNIFQLGYRSELAEEEEGAGLGLYQANRFVELHDGCMRAESRPAFKGASITSDYLTTIAVELPTIWR